MKNIFSLLILATFTGSLTAQSKLTVAIAARLSYPATVAGLRNAVEDFLDKVTVSMMVDVQELRSKNLEYRAEGLEQTDKGLYYAMSDRFDREFERISRGFILGAFHLDTIDAPVKEKEQFVKNMKQELQQSIGALLKSYGAQFQINSNNT